MPVDVATQGDIRFDAYAVNDKRQIVGSIKKSSGSRVYYQPVIWENGEFTELPALLDQKNSDGKALVANSNYAMMISDEGNIVAGYLCCLPTFQASIAHLYYPCVWEKLPNGEWQISLYRVENMPDHYGFVPRAMWTDGTTDGTVLGGILYAGAGSMLPGMLKEGKLHYWNELTVGLRDVWVAQLNKFETWQFDYVDGYEDGWENDIFFEGGFFDADKSGNFYGYKSSVRPEGNGTTYTDEEKECGHFKLDRGSCVYNIFTDKWTYNIGEPGYVVGIYDEAYFDMSANYVKDGQKTPITTHFGLNTNGISFAGVISASDHGKVLCAQHQKFNDATMQMDPYPCMIVLEDDLVGVEEAIAPGSQVKISGAKGAVVVEGAENVAVYDLQGRYVGTGADLAPGIYVVKADATTAKVIVK